MDTEEKDKIEIEKEQGRQHYAVCLALLLTTSAIQKIVAAKSNWIP